MVKICIAFLLLVILSPAQLQSMFDDPCYYIVTWSDLSKDQDQIVSVTVPSNCTHGTIDWNYPKGSILLSHVSKGSQPFELCIKSDWATSITGVKELVDGQYNPLPLPSQDKATCTKSSQSQATLLIAAPPMLRYMTSFLYIIA